MVVRAERELYDAIWQVPGYADHSPGAERVPLFLDMAQPPAGATVLDAGCGSGKGALALRAAGFQVDMMDLTDEGLVPDAQDLPFRSGCLWEQPAPLYRGLYDYVYCCDVLEHIPTEYTMLTIARLLEQVRGGVGTFAGTGGLFLSIALQPDHFGVWVGRPLHLTVRDFSWWRDRLRDLGELVEARDLLSSGVYYVRGRR